MRQKKKYIKPEDCKTYDDHLKTKEWKDKREQILKRDGHRCTICKNDENLHVHHKAYACGLYAWQTPDEYLITVCNKCHLYIHSHTKIPWIRLPYLSTSKKGQIRKHKQKKNLPTSTRKERNERRINNMMSGLSKKDRELQKRYDQQKLRTA